MIVGHCKEISCKKEVGIGMSDKYTNCGCKKCKCNKPVYPDWG